MKIKSITTILAALLLTGGYAFAQNANTGRCGLPRGTCGNECDGTGYLNANRGQGQGQGQGMRRGLRDGNGKGIANGQGMRRGNRDGSGKGAGNGQRRRDGSGPGCNPAT